MRSSSDAQVETAACAFVDALLNLEELGLTDMAERLRDRWPDVHDPTGYLGEDGRRRVLSPTRRRPPSPPPQADLSASDPFTG